MSRSVKRVNASLVALALGALVTVGLVAPALAGLRRLAATAQLAYLDKASDRVGAGATARPDNTKDGHFRLVLSGAGTVTGLTVKTVDANGKECCGQVWNTTPNDSSWILGVFRNGTQLNPTDRAVSIPIDGSVTLDLYANDSGYFQVGQRFRVDATIAGGGTATALSAPIANVNAGGGGGGGGGGGTTTTTTTTTGGGTPGAPPTARPTGTVLVNGAPFAGGTIPYNATVDVTRGAVVITADVGTLKVNGAGRVSAVFKLLRGRDKGKPVVELRLVKGDFSVCPKRKPSGLGATEAKTVRQIWGDGKGRFRTRGRYSAATVRGTKWLTADRCDGTQTKVTRGVVQVNDFPRRRQVTVRAGRSYLARP
jgi:hypothetical protein